MNSILLLFFIASYTVCCVQGQSSCTTPTNITGQCIPIKQCSQLLALLTNAERTEEQLLLLKQSQCGFDTANAPMVCCAAEPAGARRCFTPDGFEGDCVDVDSCPRLAILSKPPVSKQNMNLLRNHRCGDTDQNRVCCINCQKLRGPPHAQSGCCGIERSGEKPDPERIVTKIDQYPWMGLIEYEILQNKEITFQCGGVLISSKYVLTVAHCVMGFITKEFTPKNVRLGEYDTTTEGPDCVEAEGGGQQCTDGYISVPIDKIHVYHGYKYPVKTHDIALLRLRHAVPYTDFIRPICLPTFNVDQNELYTFYSAGWGAVSETNRESNKKLQVDLPFVPLKECKAAYGTSRLWSIWEGHICAGGVAGKSTCSGDSGGPLMSYNGFYEVVGLVSFGKQCGTENVPDVFTYVYEYLPWIRSIIEP